MFRQRWLDTTDFGMYNLQSVAKLSVDCPLRTIDISTLRLYSPMSPEGGEVIFEGRSAITQWLYNDIIFWMNSERDTEETVYQINEHVDRYHLEENGGSSSTSSVVVDFGPPDFIGDDDPADDSVEPDEEEEEPENILVEYVSEVDRYNTADAAEYIGVTRKALENWRYKKPALGPDCFKEGHNVYYMRDDLDLWLSEQ